jgi:hypothetical protein
MAHRNALCGTSPESAFQPSGFLPDCSQAGSLNAGTYITILPEVPHLEQQAIPRAAIPN